MIYCLSGTILKKTLDRVVIGCGGVGYEVVVPATVAAQLPGTGQEATLYTYMNITENDVALFGFLDEGQRSWFKLLLGVSGVGPRVAVAILGAISPERLALAISAGDSKALTAAPGVGNKLAQRIAMELKDKVGKGTVEGIELPQTAAAVPQGNATQAMAALAALGYTPSEAALALNALDPALPVEELVRLALRGMAGGR